MLEIYLTPTSHAAHHHVKIAKVSIAWVLGAEGSGIRRLVKQGCDQVARIPIGGTVESLNMSVSAALCLYETARQRASQPMPHRP